MGEIAIPFVNKLNKSFLNKRFWKAIKSNIKAQYKKIFENHIISSCQAIEKNQTKCGDYSLPFSMRADDDEQHFN